MVITINENAPTTYINLDSKLDSTVIIIVFNVFPDYHSKKITTDNNKLSLEFMCIHCADKKKSFEKFYKKKT